MARLVDIASGEVPTLRGELRAHFAAHAVRVAQFPGNAAQRDDHARELVTAIDAGKPIVLPGWRLYRFGLPQVRRGVHAYYRVDRDGRVVEVVPRRDPADRMSITAWDAVR